MDKRAGWSWQAKCVLWTAGGTAAAAFCAGAAEASLGAGGPGLSDRIMAGAGAAALSLVDGVIVWGPLSLVALSSGYLALAAMGLGGGPRQELPRRLVFASSTAFFSAAFVMAWLWDSAGFLRLLAGAVAPVSFLAALLYCPAAAAAQPDEQHGA